MGRANKIDFEFLSVIYNYNLSFESELDAVKMKMESLG